MSSDLKAWAGMQGIVSLLDDEHYALVEGLWDELEREFGVRGLYATPFPHFSYQVAQQYDPERAEAVLSEAARETQPFKVRTAGLGIFNAAQPVLYVAVVRSPELSDLHERLWAQLSAAGHGVSPYYRPEMWVPHVTLAQNNVSYEQLCGIVGWLGGRSFHWETTVNNLSLIYDTGERQGLRCRYDFGGHAHVTPP